MSKIEQEMAISELAGNVLKSLQRLEKGFQPHQCGGFNLDDLNGLEVKFFTPDHLLDEALWELEKAKLIRFCGFDEDAPEEVQSCYELTNGGAAK